MAVSKRSSVDPDLETIRLTVRMIREEPQWALSRVQRAAELEAEVERLRERAVKLAEWIERDRREPDKVLMYANDLRALAGERARHD